VILLGISLAESFDMKRGDYRMFDIQDHPVWHDCSAEFCVMYRPGSLMYNNAENRNRAVAVMQYLDLVHD
jgi:hypothetical protein